MTAPFLLGRPTVESIQRAVAREFRTTRAEMLSSRHSKFRVVPCHVAILLACQLTHRSYSEIGRRFDGRDHTTVISAIASIARKIDADPELEARVNRLRRELTPPAPLPAPVELQLDLLPPGPLFDFAEAP